MDSDTRKIQFVFDYIYREMRSLNNRLKSKVRKRRHRRC